MAKAYRLMMFIALSIPLHPLPYSIKDAVNKAFSERSSIKSKFNITRKEKSLAWAELGQYLPQVKLVAAPWLKSKEKLFGKNFTFIGMRQLIYSFAGPLEKYKVQKRNQCIAHMAQDIEYDAVQFQTRINFLDLWLAHKKDLSISSLDKASRGIFDRAQQAYQLDLISTQSLQGFQAIRAQAQAAITNYPHERNRAAFSLDRALESCSYDAIDENSAEQFIEATLQRMNAHSVDYYICTALNNRKELCIKNEEIARECLLKKLYYRSYLPDLSFFGFATNNGIIPVLTENLNRVLPTQFQNFNTFWAFGIAFGWQFDGLSNAQRASASHADAIAKELEKKDLEHQIKLEVQTAHEEMKELYAQLQAQEETLRRAQKDLEYATAQKNVGELSDIDYQTVNYQYEQARYTTNELRVRVTQKHEELLFKTGYPCQITGKIA